MSERGQVTGELVFRYQGKTRKKRGVPETLKKDLEECQNLLGGSLYYDIMSKYEKVARNRWYVFIATFFQRVVSRTPLDEKYEYTIETEKNGVQRKVHVPDDEYVRYLWFIKCNGAVVSSKSLHDMDNAMFENFNSSADIEEIQNVLSTTFANTSIDSLMQKTTIYNTSKHFRNLEFGTFKSPNHITARVIYEHGVKNKHSVQAPNGMLRLSLMEVNAIKRSKFVPMSEKYYKQKSKQVVSDYKLKSLYERLKNSKNLDLDLFKM